MNLQKRIYINLFRIIEEETSCWQFISGVNVIIIAMVIIIFMVMYTTVIAGHIKVS